MKKKKETLKERVDELEAQVRWLLWITDKHIYDDNKPVWHFAIPSDPLRGWAITSGITGNLNEETKKS